MNTDQEPMWQVPASQIREKLSELIVQTPDNMIEVNADQGPVAQILGMALVQLAAELVADDVEDAEEGAIAIMEKMDEVLDKVLTTATED